MIWTDGIEAIGIREAALTLDRPLTTAEKAAVRTAVYALVASTLLIPAHTTEADDYRSLGVVSDAS